jgi:molybdopterin molybdotransferase
VISIHEALDAVLDAVRPLPSEEVPLLQALGRAAAERIVSPEQVPSFANSAMDGFAVSGAELEAGRRQFRVVVDIPAGRYVAEPVAPGSAARIMTGAPLPPGPDTVVQVEHTSVDDDLVTVETAPPAGANVRCAGEDVGAGDVLLERGSLLGAAEIGLLAAVGIERVRVTRRPRVAILATGSELVAAGGRLAPGQIRNSNSFTAYGQAVAAGADPILLGIARDDRDETRRLLAAALENDVVVTSGGVSVGDYDFVKQVQDELGVERRFWGVATKPGKPLAFGTRHDTLVFGVPGNPVAAMVSFEMYVRPAILALQGRPDIYRPWFSAASAEPVQPTKGRTEARRCRLTHDDDGVRFTTTGPQGSGILSSMAGAEGLFFVPPQYPGGDVGDELLVVLLAGSGSERPPYPVAPAAG